MIVYEFETFRQFGDSDVRNMKRDIPCYVNFPDTYKYKITIERIDEPIEDIISRLEKAIKETTNYHVKSFCQNAIDKVKEQTK